MATSQTHVRSISLPSRLPSNKSFESQFENLKSLKNVNAENIQSALVNLAKLYTSVQECTQFPASLDLQSQLDGSVELIDSCNTIREMFHTIQENVQSLQSAIRRKGIESSSIQDDISSYLTFRKKMNKNLSRSLKALKSLEKKNLQSMDLSLSNADKDGLREATQVTTAVFRSILMYLSCQIVKSGSWNLISKMMVTKTEASKDHCVTSEVERIDCALAAKVLDGLTVQSSLQEVDSCIDGIEAGLETLYRQLIRCRVTILNIITQH